MCGIHAAKAEGGAKMAAKKSRRVSERRERLAQTLKECDGRPAKMDDPGAIVESCGRGAVERGCIGRQFRRVAEDTITDPATGATAEMMTFTRMAAKAEHAVNDAAKWAMKWDSASKIPANTEDMGKVEAKVNVAEGGVKATRSALRVKAADEVKVTAAAVAARSLRVVEFAEMWKWFRQRSEACMKTCPERILDSCSFPTTMLKMLQTPTQRLEKRCSY